MLWSSLATAKFIASIGFHDIAFPGNFKIVLARGMDVRKSYRTIDLSVAAEPRIEVSIGLKETFVIVSVVVGHLRTSGVAFCFSKS